MAKDLEKQELLASEGQKKAQNQALEIINVNIELLKNEFLESKLYLELCLVTLLVLVFGYFKTESGQQSIVNGTMFGRLIIVITIGLYIGVVYFFYTIIRFNHKNKELMKQKINEIAIQK